MKSILILIFAFFSEIIFAQDIHIKSIVDNAIKDAASKADVNQNSDKSAPIVEEASAHVGSHNDVDKKLNYEYAADPCKINAELPPCKKN